MKTKSSTTQVLFRLMQSDLVVLWRQRKSVVMSLILPLIFLISWKGVVAQAGGAFVLGTCITVGLVGIGVLSYPGLVARDRERGVFQRLRATPIPSWTIMVSRLVVQLLVIWLMAAILLISAYLLNQTAVDVPGIILILILSVVAGSIFLALGQAIVGLIGAADSVNSTARLLSLPLIFVGGLGELGYFGNVIQTIVEWSPFGVAKSLIQYAIAPASGTGQFGLVLVMSVVYIILFAGIGIRWFKWSIV